MKYNVIIPQSDPLRKYKIEQLGVADACNYSQACAAAIAESKSEIEIDNHLTDARNGKL